ncbi:MAG: FtsX-like permease family protein [Vicinamibacterales bacterium]
MFIVRMAWRELRWAWRRLLFFFLCLSIGVASIVTLRSVVQSVRAALRAESRTLLGADLVLSTSRPWAPGARGRIDALAAPWQVSVSADEIETLTMVRPADERKAMSRLVELLGVEPAYPLYGALELDGSQRYAHALLKGRGMLVRPELLAQLDIAVGDEVIVGDTRFTIRGVVVAEPGRRAGAFSFGTRVLVDLEDLRASGLLGFGSRATHRVLLKLPEAGVARLTRELRQAFRGAFVSVRSYQSAEDQMGRELARAENYLSLVGLIIVILGGVGVWSVIRVFVQQKLRSVAILKCVGGGARQVLAIYVAQVVLMGLTGSALGLVMASVALVWLGPVVATATGLEAAVGLTASAAAQGAGIGLLVALLFALVPLLEVRHVRPSLLLRASEPARPRRDAAWFASTLGIGVLLVALAAWQAGSWRVGAILAGGFAGVSALLVGAGALLVRALRPLRRSRLLAVRYASRRVGRPGSQVRPILLAVGLAAFLVVGVRVLQDGLLQALALNMRPDSPDLFLIDVQPDQAEPVRAFLRETVAVPGGEPVLIPVLRARITGIRGREVTLDSYEDVRARGGGFGREYVVTYRSGLADNERLVAGEFWPAGGLEGAQVSVEQGIAARQQLRLGDTVQFDILGRSVEASITSIRKVDWADARAGGFMFVFRPGALESAPATFIAPVIGPPEPAARARFQRDVTAAFPNVSVIDVREILAGIARVLRNLTLAVSVVGALVLVSGLLILVGSISMTRFQRMYEVAVLKTLGATAGQVAAMLAVEYSLIGASAGVVGCAGALGLSWAVSRFVLELPWEPAPGTFLAGFLGASALVAAVGVLASLDVLRRKPLSTLRAE